MTTSLHNTIAIAKSRAMFGVCVIFTVVILTLLALVTGYLLSIGVHSLHLSFFRLDPIPPGMAGAPGGMHNALIGTGVLIALASLIGIPVGILTGIYLAEYDVGSRLATPVRFVSDVLAGVPSIVVGILGYELVVRPIGNFNGWAGAFALAFIMVPIIARTAEEMLRLVPGSYREASVALGATKARTILRVVIPSAMGSLVTGVMLAIARVAGETAPLLFTALGSRFSPFTFDGSFPFIHGSIAQPFPSLTVQIFEYARGPYDDEKKLAWAGILVLISLIFLLNLGIRFATSRRK
jgi:phosphate transport system permease protein